jgi:XTP/dITP diphosphohydrolase
MRELLVATSNKGKLSEILEVLGDIPFKVVLLSDVKKASGAVEENGETFEENAILKAKVYGLRSGMLTLAEDTGLSVEALNGRPGVHSARYGATDDARNERLLKELESIPEEERTAMFTTVVAIYDPKKNVVRTAKGQCSGRILHERRGNKSFGYGPLFYVDTIGKTLSEADMTERNRISHRGKAVIAAREILLREFV